MRWLLPGVLVPCLTATPIHADTFSSTRTNDLVEKAHAVHVTLRRDHAELRVTRTVHNGGKLSDQALFHVNTPSELIATGLRTSAMVNGKLQWFMGDLLEAEAAARKYAELAGIGGYYPKDPALLSWREPGHLLLQVFPCPPGEDKTVEYTLLAPMRYEAGRYAMELAEMGTEAMPATATITADEGRIFVDGKKAPATVELREKHRIELEIGGGTTVEGRLAAVPFDREKALFSYHLDVPARLSPRCPPKPASSS